MNLSVTVVLRDLVVFVVHTVPERINHLLVVIKAGVIDPTKVARVALENAASIAGMFLTTECIIADKKEENPAPMPPMGGGMGGMM